jgi:hypothetical protein
MFPHRPSRLPDTVTTPQRSSRAHPRPRRRRCCPGVAGLEDRTLLNGHTLETATPLAFTANRAATMSGFLASPKDEVDKLFVAKTGVRRKLDERNPADRLLVRQ